MKPGGEPSHVEALLDRIRENGTREACYWRGRSTSYAELAEIVAQWEARLRDQGIGMGALVGVFADYSPQSVGLLLALMRVEGIAWVAVLLVLAIVSRWIAGRRSLRPLLACVLIIAIGYGLYFAARYAYYQQPCANTVYAKLEPSAESLWRGCRYVLVFLLTFLTPALIVPGSLFALRRKRLAIGLPTAAMAWETLVAVSVVYP